jgi:hypothetical protein
MVMDSITPGDLVKVAVGTAGLDGIVFVVPSATKVVVAVVDRKRGPGFRTVSRSEVSERDEPGPDDPALRLLIKRTPPPPSDSSRGASGAAHGRAGFKRGAAHRATGR